MAGSKLCSGPGGNQEAEIILHTKGKQYGYVKMQAVYFNEEAGFGFTPCSYLKAIEKCKPLFIFTTLCDETRTLEAERLDSIHKLAEIIKKKKNLTSYTFCLKYVKKVTYKRQKHLMLLGAVYKRRYTLI